MDVTEEGLQISAHGLRRDGLEIILEESCLRVVGERTDSGGPFDSVIDVPAGFDAAKAKAFYLHGELRIVLPRLKIESHANLRRRQIGL